MTELFIKYLKGHVGDIYVMGRAGGNGYNREMDTPAGDRREKRRTRHSPVGKA